MCTILSGVKIAVLGGDDRELILIGELVKMGATVAAAGFPPKKVSHGAFTVHTVEEACNGSEVVILPLSGTSPDGVLRAKYAEESMVLTEKDVQSLAPRALMIIGSARGFLKEWSQKYDFTILEIIEMDELAILNSIPTAEGAIQIAMENTDITIHGSQICVIGFGRVAVSLARMLKGIGAEVTVVARNPGQLARAYEMGCHRAGYSQLRDLLNSTNIVFNTVPTMVLDKSILKYANPDVLLIDLASHPGGIDFQSADMLGLNAIFAPSLPGKVASAFAGKILADVIPRLIMDELNSGEHAL